MRAPAAGSTDPKKGKKKEGTDGVEEMGSVEVGSSIVSGKMM
ncbi:hypothetical protein [Nitrosovibrio sp. Nv17]|nr:hypothetical protein [Nitrosovibrio sp. Nv17]